MTNVSIKIIVCFSPLLLFRIKKRFLNLPLKKYKIIWIFNPITTNPIYEVIVNIASAIDTGGLDHQVLQKQPVRGNQNCVG